jgi:UDP-glucose 4-epimerase
MKEENKYINLILGHSGFIGHNLEKYLKLTSSNQVMGHSLPNLDLTKGNDLKLLNSYLHEDVNLIILAGIKRQFGDTLETFKINISMIENLAQILAIKKLRRVIFMSSAAVYGEETTNLEISEKTNVNPTSYYGIGKFTSECLLKKFSITPCIFLRPPLVYGEGDKNHTYGPTLFTEAAINSEEIQLWGDGSELREFLYIKDLCEIINILIKIDEFPEGPVNIVSGVSHSFLDILDILIKQGIKVKYKSRVRSKIKSDNIFIASKIKSILPSNFKFTSLESGLVKYYKNLLIKNGI